MNYGDVVDLFHTPEFASKSEQIDLLIAAAMEQKLTPEESLIFVLDSLRVLSKGGE